MTVTVNGDRTDVPDGASVVDLLEQVTPGRGPRGIAVAINGEVVPRSLWGETRLDEEDRVEVLSAVGGG